MTQKIACALLLLGCAQPGRAAQIYTETFPTDFSGWDNIVPVGSGFWSWNAGQLRLDFDDQGGFSFPDQGRLEAFSYSSGGRFVGNWNTATARIDAIGFDFRSEHFPPSHLQVQLFSGDDNPIYGHLPKPPVGVTEGVFLSAEQLADGWNGSPIDTEEIFQQVRSNVSSVLVTVFRNNPTAHSYILDNIFLARHFRWDGGTNGLGTNWLTATNWFPDGFAGTQSRIIFASTGSAQVINVDSSAATGGVIQVGQLFCTESNRTFETASVATNSKMQFNGYGGVFVTAGSNTVTFRNGPTRRLELVGARYRGIFDVPSGGSIIISNCVISETNVACRVDKAGNGFMYLGASNKHSGGTRVLGGLLQIGHTNSLGTGPLIADGGLLDLNGFAVTITRLSGATGVVYDASAGVGTNTITLNQTTNTIFTGSLSNGPTKAVALVKNGTGTLVIAGTNFNTGPTTINAGRLLLDANGEAGGVWRIGELGPGPINVATGGLFGGAGRARGLVDNAGLVQPGTGTLICTGGYLQRTNATLTFQLGGTNAALNQNQFTDIVVTNLSGGTTNVVTNTVLQTALYQRLEIPGPATFGGLLRVQFVNGFTPQTGDVFHLITAPLYNGFFSTNSLLTNNLPAPGPGREWSLRYHNTGVSLHCVAPGTPVRAFATPAYAHEGNAGTTNLDFFIFLTRPATATVSLAWTVSNGTALAGTDYTATNGLLEIPPGFQLGQITIPVLGDTTLEYDETLTLHLTALTNALPGNTNSTATILNDDPLPLITIATLTTNEGAATNLIITLAPASGIPASFTYTFTDGTALAPDDYTPTTGVFTIPPGQTTASLPVPVLNDGLYETNETLLAHFSAPSNSTLGTAQTLITLLNDEPYPQLNITGFSSGEGDIGTRNFPANLTLAPASAFPVTFTVATTTNGSATPGVDFFPTNTTLTFPPGVSTAALIVIIISDPNTEPNETITLTVTTITNATPGTPGSHTIFDDDFNPYPGFLGFVQQIADGQQRGYWDDPDLDGQPNIYEYAFLSHPDDANSIGLFFAAAQNGIPGVRFGRNLNATDIIIEIETTDLLIETINPGDPENEIPPTTNAVTWYTIATNSGGLWTGPATVTETGLTNPITSFIHDPAPATLTNRHHRLLVRPPP